MSGFDIDAQAESAKQEDAGTVVEISGIDELPAFYNDAEDNKKPVTITVAGAHSPAYRRIEAAIRRRKLKPRQLTGEAIFDDNIEKVVACTLAWEGFIIQGASVDLTPHNVRQVYLRCPWVYEQVLEAMHDHTRFFGKESKPPVSS